MVYVTGDMNVNRSTHDFNTSA